MCIVGSKRSSLKPNQVKHVTGHTNQFTTLPPQGPEGHKGQKSIKAITEGKLRNLTSCKVEILQPNADCFGIRA